MNQPSDKKSRPVAWRVDGKNMDGFEQTWFYWKPELPEAHAEHGHKVTPLYEAAPSATGALVSLDTVNHVIREAMKEWKERDGSASAACAALIARLSLLRPSASTDGKADD